MSCPVKHDAPAVGGCPVKHDVNAIPSECPMSGQRTVQKFLEGAPEFPAARKKVESTGIDNVGDIFPDSKPILGQRIPLSNVPTASNIPKSQRFTPIAPPTLPEGAAPIPENLKNIADKIATANAPPVCTSDEAAPTADGVAPDETWTFPSHQRFYNAMKKKGWNPNEIDIPYVVSVHNTVNQQVWRQILRYEKYHEKECATPKLLRFQGRPTDLSPKAYIQSTIGYSAPYDRHDWIIDRCGKDVRYVIDFYDGQRHPTLPVSTHIDARPALDSVGAAVDRLRAWFESKFEM